MSVVRRLVVMILSGLLATVVVLPAVASVSRPKVVEPVAHQARGHRRRHPPRRIRNFREVAQTPCNLVFEARLS